MPCAQLLPFALPPCSDSDLKSSTQAILAGAILMLLYNFAVISWWALTDHGAIPLSLRGGEVVRAAA